MLEFSWKKFFCLTVFFAKVLFFQKLSFKRKTNAGELTDLFDSIDEKRLPIDLNKTDIQNIINIYAEPK